MRPPALTYRRIEVAARAIDAADRELGDRPLAAYQDGATFLARLREDMAMWLRLAGKIEEELGRTPTSRAKLGLHIAQTENTLAQLAAEGREARARSEQRLRSAG